MTRARVFAHRKPSSLVSFSPASFQGRLAAPHKFEFSSLAFKTFRVWFTLDML